MPHPFHLLTVPGPRLRLFATPVPDRSRRRDRDSPLPSYRGILSFASIPWKGIQQKTSAPQTHQPRDCEGAVPTEEPKRPLTPPVSRLVPEPGFAPGFAIRPKSKPPPHPACRFATPHGAEFRLCSGHRSMLSLMCDPMAHDYIFSRA